MLVQEATPATITVRGVPEPRYAIGYTFDMENDRYIFGAVYQDFPEFYSWTVMRYGADYFDPNDLVNPELRNRYGEDFHLDVGNEIVIKVDEFVRALRELGLIQDGR